MNKKDIKIFKAAGAQLPMYQTEKAAGFDFHAYLEGDFKENGRRLEVMERALIGTGIFMDLGDNEMQIRPRSGLAKKHGITVLNSPGTIDGDYRGEIKILLINLGQEAFTIKQGERIAQGVVSKPERVDWSEVHSLNDLEPSQRGAGGFGSTGVKDKAEKFETGPVEVKKEVTAKDAKAEAEALEADFEIDDTQNTFASIGLIPSEEALNPSGENAEENINKGEKPDTHQSDHGQERRISDQPVSGSSDTEEPVEKGNGQKTTGKRGKTSKKSSEK